LECESDLSALGPKKKVEGKWSNMDKGMDWNTNIEHGQVLENKYYLNMDNVVQN
jgi:hypothetical protein